MYEVVSEQREVERYRDAEVLYNVEGEVDGRAQSECHVYTSHLISVLLERLT